MTVPWVLPGAGRSTRPTAWMMSVTELRGSANSTPSTDGTSTPSVRHRALVTTRTWPSWALPSQRIVSARAAAGS
jgi:hypothetical protein